MATDKKHSQYLFVVFTILVVTQAIAILSDTKGCESVEKFEKSTIAGDDEESKRIRQELLDKYSKNNPPPMIDPFTGNVIAKATTIKVVKKAIEKGEDKVTNPITSHDFCGNGKVTRGVWTEIEALKRAQTDMQAARGSSACLQITSSCRSNVYQYTIWKKYWVIGKDGKPELKSNNDPVTSIVVGKPGYSFHEACRAFDISNYEEAQTYLWKQGFAGGTRGLPKDFVHFSRGGEFTNAEILSIRNISNQIDKYTKKGGKYISKYLGKLKFN